MGCVLRICTLFLLCVLGDMWMRNESGLYLWEKTDVQASPKPERDATWAPTTTCTQQDSSPSTIPWTDDGSHSSAEGQGCGNILPDSDAVFAYQVFALVVAVASFFCVGCCCAGFLDWWLASSLESPSEPENIPMTISRYYGTFRAAMGPSTPQSLGSGDIDSLVAPADSQVELHRTSKAETDPWQGQDLPWTDLTKNTKDED